MSSDKPASSSTAPEANALGATTPQRFTGPLPSVLAEQDPARYRPMLRALFVVHLVTAAGFNVVLPFLPLYVKELAPATMGTAFWSGVIFAAPAFTMMIASPIWGQVADRFGRKPMLVRATFAGGLVLAMMGLARSVTQVSLLRALQGMLTGYQAASNALVAATVPRTIAGGAMGFLRTGTWVGVGVGPLVGGLVAENFGFRASFYVTGGLLMLSTALVMVFVKEQFIPPRQAKRGFFRSYRELIARPGLRHLYGISFLDSAARAALMPVFPLFIRHLLGKPKAGTATVTGLLLGLRAIAGSLASMRVGRLGDRIGHGKVVVISTIILCLLYAPQPFVNAAWQLVALHVLIGVFAVGLVPGVGALFALQAPEGQQGAVFALESSIDALGRTLGPMIGAAITMTFGLRGTFAAVALFYGVLIVVAAPLYRVVAEPMTPSPAPPAGAEPSKETK
jgi:DHA1 family multidrug resistance protein-like MFS transporter